MCVIEYVYKLVLSCVGSKYCLPNRLNYSKVLSQNQISIMKNQVLKNFTTDIKSNFYERLCNLP